MKVYKIDEKAEIPEFATEGSACFDLRACLGDTVVRYDPYNKKSTIPIQNTPDGKVLKMHPGFRFMIPTGLIFSVPSSKVMKLYSRSGLAIKSGLVLANHVGVIDSDYRDETFVCLLNTSDTIFRLQDGDRIAQAMLEKTFTYTLEETKKRPAKTTRDGGFGSTGVE